MEKITELCTGCRSCEQLCAHQAISMQPDSEGFLTAVINQKQCVDCGLCAKRCPQNTSLVAHKPQAVYAIRDKDEKELKVSASGGAFAATARIVLQQGGIAVGAAYNEDWSVSHIGITQLNDLPKLQSSKYVQSNTEDTYKEVKKWLQEGKTVLYSGTPCQIAGLKAFLHKDYDNLLTMEVICHGVPSPKLFTHYIKWLSKRLGSKLLFYDFRDKSYGWGLDYLTKTKTKTKTQPCLLDPYYLHFLQGNTYRECCYACRYATPNRCADMTIGDYWGLEKEHPDFFSTKGVSCLLVNSEKGMEWWNRLAKEFYCIESTFEQVARINHNLLRPTKRPAIRDGIYKNLDKKPLNDYFSQDLHIPYNLKVRIKSMVPFWLKRNIKLIIHKIKHKP